MKQCSGCKVVKDSSEFYKNKRAKDGHVSRCKNCCREYQQSPKGKAVMLAGCAKYRQTEKGKEVQRKAGEKYRQTEYGKEKRRTYMAIPDVREKAREAWRKYRRSPAGREQGRKYDAKHPEKARARNAVHDAVRDGKMPSPMTLFCIECGKAAAHYHHHNGYSKTCRLDVVPVCASCHARLERET